MKRSQAIISLSYLENLVKKQEEKELKTGKLLRDKRVIIDNIIYNGVPPVRAANSHLE